MKFSYNWLKALYPKLKSAEEAARLLTLHSFQVEEIKKKGNDFQLNIDVLANRMADASGHLGIAKELAAIQGKALSIAAIKLKEDRKRTAVSQLSLKVEAKQLVPRYGARVVENVTVGESPSWIKERLEVCGLRPINAVVDITNYVMLETGQPLHAFDLDKLNGSSSSTALGARKQIIVRLAKDKERFVTLDDQELILSSSDIVIADAKGGIGLAGVKGGRGSEIDTKTSRVALEAANFDRIAIRKTSRRIGLRTDASTRFEHGIDPSNIEYALDLAAYLLQEHAGGAVLAGRVEAYSKKPVRMAVPFTIARLRSLMGIPIPESEAVSILKRLGCEVKGKRGVYSVKPPALRNDLSIEEDLIEEVGRIWGYEKIPVALPAISGGIEKKSERQGFEDTLKERIAGMGYAEAHLSSFLGEKALALFGTAPEGAYELENPTSPETAFLSPLISFQFVKGISDNLRNFDSVRLFMLGRSFMKTAEGPKEVRSLIIGVSQKGSDGTSEFYELKGLADRLLESFGIYDHRFDDKMKRHHWVHPYRVAEIKVGDAPIGVIGELSSSLQNALKMKSRVTLVEFSIEALLKEVGAEQEFRGIPKYPAVVRDLSLLVSDVVRVQEIEDALEAAGGALLIDTDLFDTYESGGKKSVAFHLVFQSNDRTLTDEEVTRDFQKIAEAAKAKGWEVRS